MSSIKGKSRGARPVAGAIAPAIDHGRMKAVQRWADALGVDRSEILRDALHRHLVLLRGEADAERWRQQPATDTERSLEAIADWGPAEDWSDWNDAAR